MNRLTSTALATVLLAAPALANVTVTTPQSGQTVGSSVHFIATANTSTCQGGVAAMGIYIDDQLVYTVDSTSLNVTVERMSPGPHNAVVQEWDNCGGATTTSVPVTVSSNAGVWVTSPANNSTASWLSNFVATATSPSCPAGIASIGVYVDNQLMYVTNGQNLNTQMNLSPGLRHTVVQEWDNCGGTAATPVDVTVVGSGNTFHDLQASTGWMSSGQMYPDYSDCDLNCPGVTFSHQQSMSANSLSGNATLFNLGGTTPYSDVLFYNHLIGAFSSQNLPDPNHTLIASLHNFTYDAYFFLNNASDTQAVEFDINWFLGPVGITWGTECRVRGGNEWDVWDNVAAHWTPTGIPCNPVTNGWNHVTVNGQRAQNNDLIYQSITLNGVTSNLNRTYPPFAVPSDWYGVTVNFQLDGDENQTSVSALVDNFSLMYW